VLAPVAQCTPEEVQAVVAAANEAQAAWQVQDSKSRASLLHEVADRFEKRDLGPLAELLTREMGKPYIESLGELANVSGVFRYMAEMARDEAGHIAGTTQTGSFQYSRYEPYGVSVHIMPFNFPFLLLAWTAAASLAAGNGIIVKPAEATTLSTLAFMAFLDCLPAGLCSCVTGGGVVGQQLVDSEGTHIVAFTGSVAVGKQVNASCARQLKPCIIEAGGNDAMLVMDSVDVDFAAAAACTAAFHLSGQVCTSSERFFVHEAMHDEFVAALVARASALRVADGLGRSEIGPLVSEAGRDKVSGLVNSALAEGASLACGGFVPVEAGPGWFYAPTVLTDVTPDMEIMNGEVFGPVASICRVGGLEEALQLANDTHFGLGASLLTARMDEAARGIDSLQAGMVWINNPMIDNDALPFGGWKQSGLGRELGRDGLNAFRRSKMVIHDAVPRFHDWWYPYADSDFHPGAGAA
jgi:acyl-CoA reductase-like NAD-dependent aldehyde dehydrogenase